MRAIAVCVLSLALLTACTPQQPAYPQQATLSGRIVDGRGAPLGDVHVAVESRDVPPKPVPAVEVKSDAQGRWTWELPPGWFDVTFRKEGYAEVTRTVSVRAGSRGNLDVILRAVIR